MFRAIRPALVVVCSLVCSAGQAQQAPKDRVPRFADYSVTSISNVPIARPIVPKDWDEDPKLRLLDTARGARANFAGRYHITVWGCGSACVVGALIEPRTGKVVPLPTVSNWKEVHDKFEGIDFRHNSRLLVLSGERNEKEGDMGQHFYLLEKGKLKFLKTIKSEGDFLTPLR